ncbi:hypothetical protein WJX74_003459 [Apatococcus lobatus]|uniref:Amine oxidase n=1 Tax=Apatococcus lobatus TaxID=904363 RepID=A0AAW1QXI7_9CHLO
MLETSTVVAAPRKPIIRRHQPFKTSDARHPLDQLSGEEVLAVSNLCKHEAAARGLPLPIRFNYITAQEPTKQDLLCYERDTTLSLPRTATALLQLPTGSTVYEATIDLSGQPLLIGLDKLEGVQPTVTLDDCLDAEEVVKSDPGIQKLLLERYGICDLELVAVDPWYYGDRFAGESLPNNARYIQCFLYTRSRPGDNHYAHPLDLLVFLDMGTRKILQTFMHDTPPQIPQHNSNFHRDLVREERGFRTGLKPLHIVQPQGPSFDVTGNRVSWQKWNMRVGFNWREGLVLHSIGYEDQGRIRPIIHRASLAEIIVPYGDPRHPFERKCAFDIVDYGLGFSANSLELGCDCLGHIHYFDGMVNNKHGEPMVIRKAVCMHEEDAGTLWKHTEYRTGHSEVRRSRRLVLSFIATIANYEYGFYWYFYQDGTIQFETKLTGCLSTSGLSPGEGPLPTHGTLVAPGLNAQIHQHFFCTRLDMAIDDPHGGANLTVSEINCEPMPEGPEDMYNIGFVSTETVFNTELEAQRVANTATSRYWKISNHESRNTLTGAPTAFKLVAKDCPPLYAKLKSSHARRGAFAGRHVWVTQHSDAEFFPAGRFPLEAGADDGIADWTKQDRNINGKDCVLWHTFGVTHVPRQEDYPVMPVEHCGFLLKPFNFFDANPGLDIPPGADIASKDNQLQPTCCQKPALQGVMHVSKL